MDHKSTGIEYDREVFVPSAEINAGRRSGLTGALMFVVVTAAVLGLGYLGYKAVMQNEASSPTASNRVLLQVQQKLTETQDRLDRLEQENHRLSAAQASANAKKAVAIPADEPQPRKMARSTYQVSPAMIQPAQPTVQTDSAAAQRITGLQQGLGDLQNDSTANHEAWQATTDRLADVAGQVGSQHGEILRNQEQLDQLLSRTEQQAISFELDRSTTPQSVGPISLVLKASNQKKQRYTLCVYVQETCIELKDRSLFEVVRFVAGRNKVPLEVIATQVGKDGIVGYLEVPRNQAQIR
jgi:hypothetical protein